MIQEDGILDDTNALRFGARSSSDLIHGAGDRDLAFGSIREHVHDGLGKKPVPSTWLFPSRLMCRRSRNKDAALPGDLVKRRSTKAWEWALLEHFRRRAATETAVKDTEDRPRFAFFELAGQIFHGNGSFDERVAVGVVRN